MANRTEGTFTLPQGRTLTFRDEGDAGRPAVLFQPGFMACRLTGRPADGARIITTDRPGIGGSGGDPKRTVLLVWDMQNGRIFRKCFWPLRRTPSGHS